MNESSMNFKVDKQLRELFIKIAKANNRNASQLLREFMQNYVREHGQLRMETPKVKRAAGATTD